MIIYGLGLAMIKILQVIFSLVYSTFSFVFSRFSSLSQQLFSTNGAKFGLFIVNKVLGFNFFIWYLTTGITILFVVKLYRLIVGLISKG